MNKEQTDKLLEAAREARENSYSPYSGFAVGAALLTANNTIFRGANIENSSYSLTVCAERVAIYSAIAAGEKELIAMAIAAQSKSNLYPCGACLQVINELAGDIPIIIDSMNNKKPCTYNLSELLPHPFNENSLSSQKR